MKSPWTKKNPFLSFSLSVANAMAGSARGRAMAAARRQAAATMAMATKQAANFWNATLTGTAPKRRKRRSR